MPTPKDPTRDMFFPYPSWWPHFDGSDCNDSTLRHGRCEEQQHHCHLEHHPTQPTRCNCRQRLHHHNHHQRHSAEAVFPGSGPQGGPPTHAPRTHLHSHPHPVAPGRGTQLGGPPVAPGVHVSLPPPATARTTLSRVVCTGDAPPRRYRVVGHSRFDAPVYQRHEDPGEGRTQRPYHPVKSFVQHPRRAVGHTTPTSARASGHRSQSSGRSRRLGGTSPGQPLTRPACDVDGGEGTGTVLAYADQFLNWPLALGLTPGWSSALLRRAVPPPPAPSGWFRNDVSREVDYGDDSNDDDDGADAPQEQPRSLDRSHAFRSFTRVRPGRAPSPGTTRVAEPLRGAETRASGPEPRGGGGGGGGGGVEGGGSDAGRGEGEGAGEGRLSTTLGGRGPPFPAPSARQDSEFAQQPGTLAVSPTSSRVGTSDGDDAGATGHRRGFLRSYFLPREGDSDA